MRDHVRISIACAVLTIAGFLIAYQFVDPAPPRRIVLSTGAEDSAYHQFGQRCRSILARAGVEVELRPSTGSVENLARLGDPDGDVDVALVQGGIGSGSETELRSLASLFYEPFWLFVRADLELETVSELAGLRIAFGAEGSGTQVLSTLIFRENGIDLSNARIEEVGGSEAADLLVAGGLDAACFVASIEAAAIRRLLTADGIRLMPFVRAEAYVRRHHFLSRVVLPRGVVDLARDRPPADVQLVAPVATLVARPQLHPALITLLLQAAIEVCGAGGVLEDPGEFPSSAHLTLPIQEDARRYLERGPPFLQRFLPFWAANFADRMIVLLIPLLTLAIPLVRMLPPILRWRVRSRIYKYYRDLIDIEHQLLVPGSSETIRTYRDRLQEIEHEVAKISVPLSYADSLYNLRVHLRLVQERIASDPQQDGR
jgi:TRAP transporter TAXI family solute receptor